MTARTRWCAFLKQQHLSLDTKPVTLPNLAADGYGTTICDLSHLSIIDVSGDDAQTFLQNQFSNDILQLEANSCQFSAYCNPQGRVITLLRIVRSPNGFFLILPYEIRKAIINRLQRFILREKVILKKNDNLIMLGLHSKLPLTYGLMHPLIQGVHKRQLLVCTIEQASELFNCHDQILGKPANLTDHRYWRMTDIHCGQPQIFSQTCEVFMPQMINLDLLDCVSFKKGCYPGQEIIARLHHLGKLKRRMIRICATGADCITSGDHIYISEHGEQKAGQIIDAVLTKPGVYHLLCTIPIKHLTTGRIHCNKHNNTIFKREPVPDKIFSS